MMRHVGRVGKQDRGNARLHLQLTVAERAMGALWRESCVNRGSVRSMEGGDSGPSSVGVLSAVATELEVDYAPVTAPLLCLVVHSVREVIATRFSVV